MTSTRNPRDPLAQQRLARRRQARHLARLKARRRTRASSIEIARQDNLLQYYIASTNRNDKRRLTRHMTITCPSIFSFIDNPDDTLKVIDELALAASSNNVHDISIDQRNCKFLDLGAEAVASVLARTALHRKRLRGFLPDDPGQQAIVLSAGMPRALGLSEPSSNMKVFDLLRGLRADTPSGSSTRAESATTQMVEYLDDCLQVYHHCLTIPGKKRFADLVGEVIANAEEHSGRREWWIAGYLRKHKDTSSGDCHIAIFNLGDTLATSLQTLPDDARLRADIEKLIRKHETQWLVRQWQPDDLWTLYALQGRVSCRNTDAYNISDNGQGTADMIQEFQALSTDRIGDTKMCVLSGHTHILFDKKYRMTRKDSVRIIAFNQANDLAQRPDKEYVRHLERSFPGTLVSLRFTLDEEHLRDIA